MGRKILDSRLVSCLDAVLSTVVVELKIENEIL